MRMVRITRWNAGLLSIDCRSLARRGVRSDMRMPRAFLKLIPSFATLGFSIMALAWGVSAAAPRDRVPRPASRPATPTTNPSTRPTTREDSTFEFVKLDTDPVTATAISEDGELFFTGHEAQNQVRVWDVKTRQEIASIKVLRPRSMIVRAGTVYVACFDTGEVAVISKGKKWSIERSVKVSKPHPFYLSAPAGKAFKGRLLVTCFGLTGNFVLDIDVVGAAVPNIVANLEFGVATISSDGTRVLTQATNAVGGCTLEDYKDFVGNHENRQLIELSLSELRYQIPKGVDWFGVYPFDSGGDARQREKRLVIPDLTREATNYALDEHTISAQSWRRPGQIPGMRQVRLPSTLARYFENGRQTLVPITLEKGPVPGPLAIQAAVTQKDMLHLFVYTSAERALYLGRGPAFPELDRSNIKPPPEDRDLVQVMDEFSPVETANSLIAFAVSEDSKSLIVSRDGMVLVWDLASGHLAHKLPFGYGDDILCRGGSVYICDGRANLIQAFDAATWKPGHVYRGPEIGTPRKLFAPGGRFFAGKVIVQASAGIVLVDTVRHTTKPLYKPHFTNPLSVDFAGRWVVGQNATDSDGKTPAFYDYRTFIEGKALVTSSSPGRDDISLYQVRPNDLWFADTIVYAGRPLQRISGFNSRGTLVPDATRDICYAIQPQQVQFIRANAELQVMGTRQVRMPLSLQGRVRDGQSAIRHDIWKSPPTAVVTGGKLHLFLRDFDHPLYHFQTNPDLGPTETTGYQAPGTFPKQVAAGTPIHFPLDTLGPGTVYTVVGGPAEAKIDASGILDWTPQRETSEPILIKIRLELGERTAFQRLETSVISGAAVVANKAGTTAGRHFLSGSPFDLIVSRDGKILLLQDRTIRILDADGQVALETRSLSKEYSRIYERSDCYVLLGDHSLDIVDHKSLKVTRSIKLDPVGVRSIAFHPTRKQTFIALKPKEGQVAGFTDSVALCIDEVTGIQTELTGCYAVALAIHPGGRLLYVVQPWSRAFLPQRPDGPETSGGLLELDIDNANPQLVSARRFENIFQPCSKISVSPAGEWVATLPGMGTVNKRGKVGLYLLDSNDISRPASLFYSGSGIRDLVFHPVLNLVATIEPPPVPDFYALPVLVLRRRDTGAVEERRVDMGMKNIRKLERACFSPGFRHILVAHQGSDGQRMIESFPLILDAKEEKKLAEPHATVVVNRPLPPLHPSTQPVAISVPESDLDVLRPPTVVLKDPRDIAATFAESVVVVKTSDGSGTGWIASEKGLVVTCAHVISDVGEPTVVRYVKENGKAVEKTYPATTLRIDVKRDLALLRFKPDSPLKSLHLIRNDDTRMGEPVTVIGNPAIRDSILTQTTTTGIVSHPNRMPMDVQYLQTTASVNPGSSGAPVFDGSGSVIGVITAKNLYLEAVGYAVASNEVRKFLESCVAKK